MSSGRSLLFLVLVAVASGACGNSDGLVGFVPQPPDPAATDLSILYVQRLPEMDYVMGSTDPRVEGWPAVGQSVTWRAHVKNWADEARDGVAYQWLLDGVVVSSGTVDLAGGAEGTVDYVWPWTFTRHELTLRLDPDDRITDEESRNNERLTYTDALSVGLFVERGVHDLFREHQRDLDIGSTTFEDWAQRQITRYNEMFEQAIYPETPQGVLDRYRLDKVTVVPDGALPLVRSDTLNRDYGAVVPNLDDHSVDLQWGFPNEARFLAYDDFRTRSDDNQFYYSGFLQHELGHARYLIDIYGVDVYDGTNGSRVDITEAGERVAGSRFMPGTNAIAGSGSETGLLLHHAPAGLMNAQWTHLDRYSAIALNLIAHERATQGNFYVPGNVGVFLADLPAENRLTVEDAAGQPLPGSEVKVYRSTPNDSLAANGSVYKMYFDDVPDIDLTADDQGRVLLGRNPFGGPVHLMDNAFTNATIIVRVAHDGHVGYGFLDVLQFNEAYWRGETDLADYELKVTLLTS